MKSFAHHPWCSRFYERRDGCEMCQRLYENYPLEDENGEPIENLAARYFPDAVELK